MALLTRILVLCGLAPALIFNAACSPDAENSTTPPSAPPSATSASGDSAGGQLRFTAPPEWIAEAPTSSMRQAQYRLPRSEGDPEDAEMVVFYFQGQGGSVQANIDRWIGQFTQNDGTPVSGAKTTRREVQGIPLTLVDVSGIYMASSGPMLAEKTAKPNFRMIAAVAETGSGPWFFKLTGPANTIAKWEGSFRSFLDTLRH